MAIAFVRNGGTNSNKAAAASIAVTVPAAGHASGNLVVVALGYQPTGSVNPSTTAVTDTQSNTYTRLAVAQTGSDGVCVFASVLTTALVSGNTITLTTTLGGPEALAAIEFSGATITADVANATAQGSSATPSAGPITPPSATVLLIGALGTLGPSGDVFTEDTDTVSGSWVTGPRVGSTGGGATTNQTVVISYKITTSSAAQTYNPSITSRGWAVQLHALQAAVTTPSRGPELGVVIQAVSRAAVR